MAALWTVGAVDIYIDGLDREKNGIWAKIQVIDATETIMHYYGAESLHLRITGHLWGTSDIETLEGYTEASTSRTFTGPNAFSKTCKVERIRSRRVPDNTDLTNECYQIEMELTVTT